MIGVSQAGTSFNNAFMEFKRLFKRETGVDWDDRVTTFHKGKGKGNLKGDGFV